MIHRIVFFYSFYLQIYLNIVKYNYAGFVFIPSFSLKKKKEYIYTTITMLQIIVIYF